MPYIVSFLSSEHAHDPLRDPSRDPCPPVERDPSKRRVKPSQQALEEFEGLALEDSSDDSDYKVDEKVSRPAGTETGARAG